MNVRNSDEANQDWSSYSDERLAAGIVGPSSGTGADQGIELFEELYLRHAHFLLAFVAARISPAEVDDVLQAVWLKVWTHIADQFQGGTFRGWLYQIARNTLIDHHRSRRALVPIDEQDNRVEVDPLQPLLEDEKIKVLKECFSTLEDREAGVLRNLLAGVSYDEVCSRLQINSNIAYKAAQSGKSKLRTCVRQKLS